MLSSFFGVKIYVSFFGSTKALFFIQKPRYETRVHAYKTSEKAVRLILSARGGIRRSRRRVLGNRRCHRYDGSFR